MYRFIPAFLLMTCLGQAWADGRIFDAERLQQQIERHVEQANKTLPAPTGDNLPWQHGPRRTTPYGQGRADHLHIPSEAAPRVRDQRGGGYGRGYERRYGLRGGASPGGGHRGSRR